MGLDAPNNSPESDKLALAKAEATGAQEKLFQDSRENSPSVIKVAPDQLPNVPMPHQPGQPNDSPTSQLRTPEHIPPTNDTYDGIIDKQAGFKKLGQSADTGDTSQKTMHLGNPPPDTSNTPESLGKTLSGGALKFNQDKPSKPNDSAKVDTDTTSPLTGGSRGTNPVSGNSANIPDAASRSVQSVKDQAGAQVTGPMNAAESVVGNTRNYAGGGATDTVYTGKPDGRFPGEAGQPVDFRNLQSAKIPPVVPAEQGSRTNVPQDGSTARTSQPGNANELNQRQPSSEARSTDAGGHAGGNNYRNPSVTPDRPETATSRSEVGSQTANNRSDTSVQTPTNRSDTGTRLPGQPGDGSPFGGNRNDQRPPSSDYSQGTGTRPGQQYADGTLNPTARATAQSPVSHESQSFAPRSSAQPGTDASTNARANTRPDELRSEALKTAASQPEIARAARQTLEQDKMDPSQRLIQKAATVEVADSKSFAGVSRETAAGRVDESGRSIAASGTVRGDLITKGGDPAGRPGDAPTTRIAAGDRDAGQAATGVKGVRVGDASAGSHISGGADHGGTSLSTGGKDGALGGKDTTPGGKDTAPGGKDTAPGGKDTTPGGKDTTPGGKDTTPGGKAGTRDGDSGPQGRGTTSDITGGSGRGGIGRVDAGEIIGKGTKDGGSGLAGARDGGSGLLGGKDVKGDLKGDVKPGKAGDGPLIPPFGVLTGLDGGRGMPFSIPGKAGDKKDGRSDAAGDKTGTADAKGRGDLTDKGARPDSKEAGSKDDKQSIGKGKDGKDARDGKVKDDKTGRLPEIPGIGLPGLPFGIKGIRIASRDELTGKGKENRTEKEPESETRTTDRRPTLDPKGTREDSIVDAKAGKPNPSLPVKGESVSPREPEAPVPHTAEELLPDLLLDSGEHAEEEVELHTPAQAILVELPEELESKAKEEEDLSAAESDGKQRDDERQQDPIYVVQPGETLESIALKVLNNGMLALLLLEINKEKIPHRLVAGEKVLDLQPGMIIALPTVGQVREFQERLSMGLASIFKYAAPARSPEEELANWEKARSEEARLPD